METRTTKIVIDNLESTDVNNPVSANQAKLLNDRVTALENMGSESYFLVNYTKSGDTYSSDKTFAEIKQAFLEGKIILANYTNDRVYLNLINYEETHSYGGLIQFALSFKSSSKLYSYLINHFGDEYISMTDTKTGLIGAEGGTFTGNVLVSADPTQDMQVANKRYVDTNIPTKVSELNNDSGFLSASAFIVNYIFAYSNGTWSIASADKTFAEMEAAYNSGQTIVGYSVTHDGYMTMLGRNEGYYQLYMQYSYIENGKYYALTIDLQHKNDNTFALNYLCPVLIREADLESKSYATQSYVNTKVADLVNSAPEALDTLGELATALQTHEDAYDALLETVGKKANDADLAAVAKSGDYNDLSNKPTIPASLPANGGNAATVNNHTVNADVPADAVFTDTTYEVATTAADGLMSATDKLTLNYLKDDANDPTVKIVNGLPEYGDCIYIYLDQRDGRLYTWHWDEEIFQKLAFVSDVPTYNTATITTDGLMSAADKAKLDGLSESSGLPVYYMEMQVNADDNTTLDYVGSYTAAELVSFLKDMQEGKAVVYLRMRDSTIFYSISGLATDTASNVVMYFVNTGTEILEGIISNDQITANISNILKDTALMGIPTAPTASSGDNSPRIATTAFVQQEIADLNSGSSVEVIDNLESTSTTDALSANMGRELGKKTPIKMPIYETITEGLEGTEIINEYIEQQFGTLERNMQYLDEGRAFYDSFVLLENGIGISAPVSVAILQYDETAITETITGQYLVPLDSNISITVLGLKLLYFITDNGYELQTYELVNDEIRGDTVIYWSSIYNTPNTLSGYGIADAYTKAEVDNKIGDISTILDSLNGEVI